MKHCLKKKQKQNTTTTKRKKVSYMKRQNLLKDQTLCSDLDFSLDLFSVESHCTHSLAASCLWTHGCRDPSFCSIILLRGLNSPWLVAWCALDKYIHHIHVSRLVHETGFLISVPGHTSEKRLHCEESRFAVTQFSRLFGLSLPLLHICLLSFWNSSSEISNSCAFDPRDEEVLSCHLLY